MHDLRMRSRFWAISPRMILFIVAVLGLAAVVYSQRNEPYPHKPVYAVAPTRAFVASMAPGDPCRATDGLPAQDDTVAAQLWVDANPSGAVVLWIPSLAYVPCRLTMTTLDASLAQVVAAAVRAAPPVPHGPGGEASCTGNDPRPVTIFLTYPGQAKAEVVRVELDQGCVSNEITAPDRTSRQMPAALATVLRPSAPQPWAAWL